MRSLFSIFQYLNIPFTVWNQGRVFELESTANEALAAAVEAAVAEAEATANSRMVRCKAAPMIVKKKKKRQLHSISL